MSREKEWEDLTYVKIYDNGYFSFQYYGPSYLGWKYLDQYIEDGILQFKEFTNES